MYSIWSSGSRAKAQENSKPFKAKATTLFDTTQVLWQKAFITEMAKQKNAMLQTEALLPCHLALHARHLLQYPMIYHDIPLIAFCKFDRVSLSKVKLNLLLHIPGLFCRHCPNRNPRLQRIQWRSSNSSWRALHPALPHIRPGCPAQALTHVIMDQQAADRSAVDRLDTNPECHVF